MTLNDTISLGLNNPDCAFFVGHFTGSMYSPRLLVTIGVMFFIFKAIEKLGFDPMIKRIKKWRKK